VTATVSNPTLESDGARFGVPVSRLNYPNGIAGVHLSLSEMCRRIEDARSSFSMQQFAEMVVRNWARVPVSTVLTHRQCAQIFLDFVRAQVRYRPDPPGTEMTKSAAILMCVPGASICIPVGDCDDLTVAFDGLCAAYGIPVKILKQIFGESDQEHVLGLIQDDDGDWLPADPSAGPDKPVGWKAPATREDVIDPLDPASIRRVGANEAEFIGVGSSRRGVGSQYRGRRQMRASPPRTVAGLVSSGLVAPVGMGLTSEAEVDSLDAQLDAQYEALNKVISTCSMSAADKTSWQGNFNAWKSLHNYWQALAHAPWYNVGAEIAAVFSTGDVILQMNPYAANLAAWQQKAKVECVGYTPPPAVVQTPVPPPGTPSGLADFAKAAAAVSGVIVVGTVAYIAIDALGWLHAFRPPTRAR
jgi:hypothetical protein